MLPVDLYHVLNRGVEKRTLFLDNQDRARFVHDMFDFNRDTRSHLKNVGRRAMSNLVGYSLPQSRLVTIHGWVLMGNHYHLLLSENCEGGLSRFLMRLNVGYAKYFNEKYERSGTLFQGRTKKILIERDAHFLHILNYIHCNPLDMCTGAENWREQRVRDSKTALKYLSEYRWSSYRDYIGVKNFPSILTTDLFKNVFSNYRREITSYINGMNTPDQLCDIQPFE